MIVAGNRIYDRCGYCQKLVRITGAFARWHLCVSPEQRAYIDAAYARMELQKAQQPFSPYDSTLLRALMGGFR